MNTNAKAAGTIDISEARNSFNTMDSRLKEKGLQVVYVTRHNKQAFAIVDIDYLSAVLDTMEILADPETVKLLEASLADIEAGRLYDHEDVKRELL